MKNQKLILLLFGLLLLVYVAPLGIKADSGWDSSYDSGGSWSGGDSWSGGGSWSGGDSWSSGGSRSYSSSGGSLTGIDALIVIGFFVALIVVAYIANGKNYNKRYFGSPYVPGNQAAYYSEVDSGILKQYEIDSESFKSMVFEKYVDIQNAWSDFDYDKLSTLLTDEIYNSYIMQLDALKIKSQKNIMSDFKYINSKIIGINEENGIINVNVYLNVEMYDYVVDKKNKVVRGSDKKKIDIEYIITFVKSANKTKSKKDVICPNCGANIKAVSGGKCSYCGTKVVIDAKDYVMSKKTSIGQRSVK